MSVDTRDKRASAIDTDLPWRTAMPAPSGTVGQAARQIAAWFYSGILASAGAVFPVSAAVTLSAGAAAVTLAAGEATMTIRAAG